MTKQPLTPVEKRLDADLWVIALTSFGTFLLYALMGQQWMAYVTDPGVPVVRRLLFNGAIQFGVAGLGITAVCLWRRETFSSFGLTRKNLLPTCLGTLLCFLPLIACIVLSGEFEGYLPFGRLLIAKDVRASGLPLSALGMALIVLVWGCVLAFCLIWNAL